MTQFQLVSSFRYRQNIYSLVQYYSMYYVGSNIKLNDMKALKARLILVAYY